MKTFARLPNRPIYATFQCLVNQRKIRDSQNEDRLRAVSAAHQNLDRQIAALRAERCDRIFREKVSRRAAKNRPQLAKAIDALPSRSTISRLAQ